MKTHDTLQEVIHETAQGLHRVGLMDGITMREFDALCLPPVKNYSALQIKRLRLRCQASQAVFAAYLNTSASTVQKWEQGQKQPSGSSLKLLDLVDRKGLDVLA
jgi:putative transcriptional regulator